MTYLDDHAFRATIISQVNDRSRRGWATDFQTIAGALLDVGVAPRRQALWDWARNICGEKAA